MYDRPRVKVTNTPRKKILLVCCATEKIEMGELQLNKNLKHFFLSFCRISLNNETALKLEMLLTHF